MTDYARLSLGIEVSTNADYSDPYIYPTITPYTSANAPLEVVHQKITCGTGGSAVTVDFGTFTTVQYVVVENLSSTIAVTVACTSISISVAAGLFTVIPAPTIAGDMTLTAASSTVTCRVTIVGT